MMNLVTKLLGPGDRMMDFCTEAMTVEKEWLILAENWYCVGCKKNGIFVKEGS